MAKSKKISMRNCSKSCSAPPFLNIAPSLNDLFPLDHSPKYPTLLPQISNTAPPFPNPAPPFPNPVNFTYLNNTLLNFGSNITDMDFK